jgi:hypothetical protein
MRGCHAAMYDNAFYLAGAAKFFAEYGRDGACYRSHTTGAAGVS